MLVKFSLMVEITDVGALRDAALKKFDAFDSTSADYPDSADWHASEECQEERRQVAAQDRVALDQFVDPAKACGLLDGVPGVKTLNNRLFEVSRDAVTGQLLMVADWCY